MKDQFVPYEQSLQLKELGYNEQDFGFYRLSLEEEKDPFIQTELIFFRERYDNHNFRLELHPQGRIDGICTAPLWQQAFDWFSDKKGLEGTIKSWKKEGNIVWMISSHKLGDSSTYRESFGAKQEARIECLKKLIELCKKNS